MRVKHQAATPRTSPEAIRARAIEALSRDKEDANLVDALKQLDHLYTVRYESDDGRMLELPDMLACP